MAEAVAVEGDLQLAGRLDSKQALEETELGMEAGTERV